MRLADRLRLLRKQNGMKLREVALQSGLSLSYISDLERGQTKPALQTLARLGLIYGLPVSEMLRDVTDLLEDDTASKKGKRGDNEQHLHAGLPGL